MRFETTGNRKETAKVIAGIIGAEAKYMGPPSFAYQIGEFTIDRDGLVETDNEEAGSRVLQELVEQGLAESEGEGKTLEVHVPTEGMEGQNLVNLIFLIRSKQHLINRSFAKEVFMVTDDLVSVLDGAEIPDKATFFRFFEQHGEGCKGISFTEENAVFAFPIENDPEPLRVFTELTAMMVKQAREQKRISHKETIEENEKYYMRVWLVRLGFGGVGGKQTRQFLLKNLNGHSAFRTEESKWKWKENHGSPKADSTEE